MGAAMIRRYVVTHPGTTILAALFLLALIAARPLPALLIVGLAAGCWYASTQHDKRHVTALRLKWRAEYEDWLIAQNNPRGIYGQYPPHPTGRNQPQ
jgi:hypothetical protein